METMLLMALTANSRKLSQSIYSPKKDFFFFPASFELDFLKNIQFPKNDWLNSLSCKEKTAWMCNAITELKVNRFCNLIAVRQVD